MFTSFVHCLVITCDDLPDPPNGEISFTIDNTAPFDFGTNATYSCDSGFGLSGEDTVRTCDGDGSSPKGEWTGDAPTCDGQLNFDSPQEYELV